MSYSGTDIKNRVNEIVEKHEKAFINIDRDQYIKKAVENGEAVISACGALATWTPPESTGRSPKDTYIVKFDENANNIDWDSPNNIALDPETADMIFDDAIQTLSGKEQLFVTDRVIGADENYMLPVRTISSHAVTSVFTDNMFRLLPEDIDKSIFGDKRFSLLVLPYDKLNSEKYDGRLRKVSENKTSNMAIILDFQRRAGVVFGSAYCGSVKKLMFTVMNYYLPEYGILPLHCSANEGKDGDCALLLGLSGTGKTTLSADPGRALLGDDEHGWSDNGVANFENGCYAKLVNLNPEKEPEIHNAVFHEDDYLKHGSIVENCLMFPSGKFDVDDTRLTPNSRGSYPLEFLSNIKPDSISGHPKTILFLTADANAVLPPAAKLNPEQAMLWFLMGYTSKLAGTETGIVDPVSTFSRFFGEPFMPRNPEDYASLLGKKMKEHGTQVYLINTGWSGGPYGVGKRMDINLTRKLVESAINGTLKNVEYEENELFHLSIPKSCPGVDEVVLNPRNTWEDKNAFDKRAEKLAKDFSNHYDKAYGNKNIDPAVKAQCPGK
ncbi:MAG: phosphoenolpyruvate carboxykinase (ATP) [Candidatus Cloacimonadota bacterium]|nr:MAG: phosphoenolpyruvate carboxykinase (ATP) [Candidatus Cloacimonadota bacterium]